MTTALIEYEFDLSIFEDDSLIQQLEENGEYFLIEKWELEAIYNAITVNDEERLHQIYKDLILRTIGRIL